MKDLERMGIEERTDVGKGKEKESKWSKGKEFQSARMKELGSAVCLSSCSQQWMA